MIPFGQEVQRKHRLREYTEISRKAFRAAGEAWVAEVIPKHFTSQGATEYGYELRDPGYQGRKIRAIGHQRPLEFTGTTRQAAERSRLRVSAHRGAADKSVRIKYDAPTYITGKPARLRELEAVSDDDEQVAVEAIDAVLTDELERDGSAEEV